MNHLGSSRRPARSDFLAVALRFAELPTIEVRRSETDAREREFDLGAVFDAMLGGVEEEEALREVEALTLPGQIDVTVLVERFGDRDEIIARCDGE